MKKKLDKAWFNYWMNQLEETNVKYISSRTSLEKSQVYRLSLNADFRTSSIYKLKVA